MYKYVAVDDNQVLVNQLGKTAHRFRNFNLSVSSEMKLFWFQIISPEVTVEKIRKLVVTFLFPKSLWFEFHRQSRTVPACNCPAPIAAK